LLAALRGDADQDEMEAARRTLLQQDGDVREGFQFTSPPSNTTEPRDYFINPGCFGDDVAAGWAASFGRQGSSPTKSRGKRTGAGAVFEGETGAVSVTVPKGGKPRVVPMTSRLQQALQEHRHLRGARVLYQDDGADAAKWWLKWLLDRAERGAGLRPGGRVHILRHTFCSRLAARNVPMLTIKELAGHVSIETTMRYMHLSSAAPRAGIRALEAGVEAPSAGAEKPSENAE
jgi:hypothetical protein